MHGSFAPTSSPAVLHRLSNTRRAALKVSYTVRALDGDRPVHLLSGPGVRPQHGDVVVAEVTGIGRHTRLESAAGRRAHLFPGDEVLVAYGARYAPDQFEAEPPADLGPCDLVAAGGIAAEVISAHADLAEPTTLKPVGLAADAAGEPVNMTRLAAPRAAVLAGSRDGVPTVAVVGTSMNAGKTTTGAALVRGLTAAGYRVGAAKVTGTGAGGDRWMLQDSGAFAAADFTDAGLATTYRVPIERILAAARDLHDGLVGAGADAVVLEVADGLLQPETAELLKPGRLPALVQGWVFAAGDAAGALYGTERLRAAGLPVLAVSGRMTASPLAVRECARHLDLPVHGLDDLADPAIAAQLTPRAVVQPVRECTA
ncbi:P-loop NTPase family protein [Streptomonospora litoralis]|uniref:DUF1611 domain-containing protein n=1 Tax=Streptomonospora litoralis TaxID=2498135 RepID=A0A4P6Q4B8_9ACTN|nr:DUF1611 domain-containing protein [Streptomonospora litoralis]QBI55423.1 hypothetical protein EKD16_18295 [Streptomonospora litoralis]